MTASAEDRCALFAQMGEVCKPDALIVPTGSAVSVTRLASACRNPNRIVGMHFRSPVPQTKLVEVVDGLRTDPAAAETATVFARRLGREPVAVADTPGFIVDQIACGYGLEAAQIAAEGTAPFEAIDRILREGCGFHFGPFEMIDQIGIDATLATADALQMRFYGEPRYRATPLIDIRADAGLLGRKSKGGFYEYDSDGRRVVPEEGRMPAYDERWVWVSPENTRVSIRIKSIVKAAGGILDEGKDAHPKSLIVVTPIGEDATTCVTRQRLDPERSVAIDAMFGLVTRRTVMKTPATKLGYAACGLGLFAASGAKATLIHDTVGFVAQRVVAQLVNIASAVAQSGVAPPENIDKAAALGLGAPKGPLAWGDDVGAGNILKILDGLVASTGDPRYRPSPWLRRRVQLGISLLTPES
jgi:3-hydroxybutyryl-CoA dehydrogenase